MLENGSDLHINERQKIRHYPLGLLKKSRGMYVNGAIIAVSYTHLIRIINNNNNRPPACTSFSYGTGNKVSRNDGLTCLSRIIHSTEPGLGPGSIIIRWENLY